MKKITKTLLCLTLVFAVAFCSFTTFAATNGNEIRASHVEFVGEITSVTAKSFVRNAGTPKEATLILAIYGNDGTLVDVKTATGANTILEAGPVNADNKVLKAFVWEETSKKVLTDTADFNASWETIKASIGKSIKFDGVSFENYVDEFDADTTTYTKNGTAGDPDITMPKITADFNNAAVNVKVVNDNAAKKSIITVEYGFEDTTHFENVVVTGSYNYDHIEYTKTYSATYTVNYVPYGATKQDNKLYIDDVTTKSAYSHNNMPYQAHQRFELGGQTYREVNINVGDPTTTRWSVVIKPVDGAASKKIEDIFVKEDGSNYISEDFSTFKNLGSGTDSSGNKVFNTKYLKKVVPMSYTVGGNTYDDYKASIVENFHEADGYDYGSCTQDDDLFTSMPNMVFDIKDESLIGCPYLVIFRTTANGGSWNPTNVSFTFYVKQDVDVYLFSKLDNIPTDKGWIKDTQYNDSNPAVDAAYQDGSTNLAVSYMLATGFIKTEDLNIGNAVRINKQGAIIGNEPDALKDGVKTDLKINVDGVDYTIAQANAVGVSDKVLLLKVIDALVDLWDTSVDGKFTERKIISDYTMLGDYTSKPGNLRLFDYTENYPSAPGKTKYRIFCDKEYNLGCFPTQYGSVFNLYGAEAIATRYDEWPNIASFKNSVTGICSFKVTEDAEVFVFTGRDTDSYKAMINAGTNAEAKTDIDKWSETKLKMKADGGTDTIFTAYYSDAETKYVSSREFAAGETVTIYSPAKNARYIIIVKPIEK